MGDLTFEMRPVGFIRTAFREQVGTPIQGAFAPEAEGLIEVLPEFREGLSDLDGYSHAVLLYVFDRCKGFRLKVVPYLDTVERGVFSTHAPRRPNPIGVTTVRLIAVSVEEGWVRFAGADMLDGTPLLDIKPYLPDLDPRGEVRTGWFGEAKSRLDGAVTRRADGRFSPEAPDEADFEGSR